MIKDDTLSELDQTLSNSTNDYYTEPYTLGQTKEQITIGNEVAKPKELSTTIDTSDTSIEKTDRTYSLTFSTSPDGLIWSMGIDGLERTFKVGFFGNTTLAYETIVTEMQTWLGTDYTITYPGSGSVITISKYDGSEINKTEPNLVRNISLTSFDSTSVIDVTVDGVTVSLDGATHSGSATTAITYLKGQLSSSIYYMNSSTSNLIIARKDGAIPVISKTQYNRYTTEIKYQYNDTPNTGQYHNYTNTTIEGTTYYYYGSQGRAFDGDKIIRNLKGYIVDNPAATSWTSTTSTAGGGYTFTASADLVINTVTKEASSTATRCRLFTSGGTVLATATFSGNVATFGYTISKNTTYRVEADNSGASFTNRYSSPSYPITNEFITYTGTSGSYQNITSINATTVYIPSTYNPTYSFNGDTTWNASRTGYYFAYHTVTMHKDDYSTMSVSSINHYTNPGSFPDDTLYTTITETNHKADITTTTYTEITITDALTSNNYYIPLGFQPNKIDITAEASVGRSTGTWESGPKRGEQFCNSSVSGLTNDKIFKTSSVNYGNVVRKYKAGVIMSWATTVANKLSIFCNK